MLREMFKLLCLVTAFQFTAPQTTLAQINGDDLSLIGTTPSITMDDTDSVSVDWIVRGREEFFHVRHEASAPDYLYFDRTLISTALGASATAGGITSTALGRSASSVGGSSIALGRAASSPGGDSTALGFFANSGGQFSIALGNLASSAGLSSTAVGVSTFSDGTQSTAVGASASSTGDSSTALGREASSVGPSSIALGFLASSSGLASTALGHEASSVGVSSTALGHLASAGSFSTALGYRATATELDTIVLGEIPGVNGGSNYVSVANGTMAPLAPLHIFRDDGTAQVLVEESSMDAVPRTLFRLASAGSNAKFEIDNTMADVNWAFTNSGSDFRISRQGSGVVEFRVDNAGNAFIVGNLEVGGNLLTNVLLRSDRNAKRNVEAIDPETVLDKIAALPVSAWEYSDRPGERHIGPMAQDFHAAFGLGSGDEAISVVDASGVALASIQALEARNRELESRVSKLEAIEQENAELKERLALVEALVMHALPKVTQN